MILQALTFPAAYFVHLFLQFTVTLWRIALALESLINYPLLNHSKVSLYRKKSIRPKSTNAVVIAPHRFYTAFVPVTLRAFEGIWPQLVQDIKLECGKHGLSEQAVTWFERSLQYNAVGGKCNRGMSVVDTVAILLGRDLTDEEFTCSATLGWTVELLQATFLVSDDIMDSSKTRRGAPCWYLVPDVGMIAINDVFMLGSSIYILLKKYFQHEDIYVDLIELFHTTCFQTELGQACDLLTAPENRVDLDNFSLEKYTFIVIHKTAYYSFYLPVALALHYTGRASKKNLRQARDILIPMGEYFQVQDDFLDNYADPDKLGKIGTDIQDNKCSWLVNKALEMVTKEQRVILEENYGRKNKHCETRVKAVYEELRLDQVYHTYEEEKVGHMKKLINTLDESEGLNKLVFEEFLRKIYRRLK